MGESSFSTARAAQKLRRRNSFEMRVHPSCFVLFTLLSLAVVAEDQWAETSTLSAPDARKIPQIVQLAEKAFRLVKPLADQTNVETNTPLNENSASPGQTSSTVLAQAASQVMGDTAETFVVFKLPESGDFKAWLFIVLCLGIVVFSILFEVGLHAVRHAVMNLHGWKHVFQKIEDEFFLLGIISFVFFFCYQGIAEKDYTVIEHFELAHYVLFAIGLSYSYHAILIHTGMFPKFKSWADHEVSVRNPTAEFSGLTHADGKVRKHAREAARWAVIRRAYIDRYGLPAKFNYGEYLHQIAIDYIAEVMEASWVEWLITTVYASVVTGIVSLIFNFTDLVDLEDMHACLSASSVAFIISGWVLFFAYYGVYIRLLHSRRHCLQLLGLETDEQLMDKFSQVMSGETVSWPDGWVECTDGCGGGVDLMNKGWVAESTPTMLAAFLLAFNFYAALAAAVFCRAVIASHTTAYAILMMIGIITPYLACIMFLAPKCLGVYTEIHAFQSKDENIALELLENQQEADRMAKIVLEHLHASHIGGDGLRVPPDEVSRMFGEFDVDGDGHIDHKEFVAFMKKLEVKMSDERLTNLILIVDPAGRGHISREDLMYWLLPEDHDDLLKKSMSDIRTSSGDMSQRNTLPQPETLNAPLLGTQSK